MSTLNIINANAERLATEIVDLHAEGTNPNDYVGRSAVVQLHNGETQVGTVEAKHNKYTPHIPNLIIRFDNGTWSAVGGTLYLV